MFKFRYLILLLLLTTLLSSCQLLAAQVATDFNLELKPEALTVARGGSGTLTLRVTRIVPVDVLPVPITVTLHNPPTGVSADPLELPSGITEDTLTLRVAADAAPGGPSDVRVRGTNGVKTKEVTFKLTIIP